MRPVVEAWTMYRTRSATQWSVDTLTRAKAAAGVGVSVVIPARDEEATVGAIVRTIRRQLRDRHGLVDEIIVVDSRSTDRTAEVAADAGATVVSQDLMTRALPRLEGKGDALWCGLAAAGGDLVAFVDGDLRRFGPRFVTGLLGPLLTDPSVAFVKGFYRRPLVGDGGVEADGGGRVTELMARPLLNLFWPELAGFVQPLAGEYAARRDVLTRLPFVSGYGVEVAMLIDLLDLVGLDALAQVDLGERRHRHQDTAALGRMSAQILVTVWTRLHRRGLVTEPWPPATMLTQFTAAPGARIGGLDGLDSPDGPGGAGGLDGPAAVADAVPHLEREIAVWDVAVAERPPLASMARPPRPGRPVVSVPGPAPA